MRLLVSVFFSFLLIQFVYADDSYTVNMPASNGSYMSIDIRKVDNYYLGPLGERYDRFPTVYELERNYAGYSAIQIQQAQQDPVLKEKMAEGMMNRAVEHPIQNNVPPQQLEPPQIIQPMNGTPPAEAVIAPPKELGPPGIQVVPSINTNGPNQEPQPSNQPVAQGQKQQMHKSMGLFAAAGDTIGWILLDGVFCLLILLLGGAVFLLIRFITNVMLKGDNANNLLSPQGVLGIFIGLLKGFFTLVWKLFNVVTSQSK